MIVPLHTIKKKKKEINAIQMNKLSQAASGLEDKVEKSSQM